MMTFSRVGIVLCLLLVSVSVIPQESDAPKPDRGRGLIIDEAAPDDAIKVLGAPESDKVDRIRVNTVDTKWISKRQGEKIFRKLQFKKPAGFDQAELSFLDGKLVLIELDFDKEIQAAALSRIYGIQFFPKVSGFQEGMFPKDYERNEGRVYPKSYPSVYYLIAVTERALIGAMVENIGLGAVLRSGAGVSDTGDFPGKAGRLQIVSRRLENKDGAELLKE